MKINKTLRVLIVVFVVLLALALVKKIFVRGSAIPLDKADKASLVKVAPKILEEFVTRLVFYKGDEPDNKVIMAKSSAGDWVVESLYGAKARAGLVPGLINDLSEMRGELRGDSRDVLEDFQIRDEEGLHIIIEGVGGQEIYHAVVGLKPFRWNMNFIRQAGTNKVVLVNSGFLDATGLKKPGDKLQGVTFSDPKRVFDLKDMSKIRKIWIRTAAPSPVLLTKLDKENDAKLPAGWYVDPPQARSKADERKVMEYLRQLMGVHAKDIFDPKGTNYGLDTPVLSVAVETLEEDKTTRAYRMDLALVSKPERAAYVQTFPEKAIFSVREESVAGLIRDKEFFLKASNLKTSNTKAFKKK